MMSMTPNPFSSPYNFGFFNSPNTFVKPKIPGFNFKMLRSFASLGLYGCLLGSAYLFFDDLSTQWENRDEFCHNAPKQSHVDLSINHGVAAQDMLDTDFKGSLEAQESNDLFYYIGIAQKDAFRGLFEVPGSEKNTPTPTREDPLPPENLNHLAIVFESANKKHRPLILGRQSAKGPVPTLMEAFKATYYQLVNASSEKSAREVFNENIAAHIENERQHLASGTSFDTTVIKSVKVPKALADQALKKTQEALPTVMNFASENCMTTTAFYLLTLCEEIAQASKDGSYLLTTTDVDNFKAGTYELINKATFRYGYGVFNNDRVVNLMKEVFPKTSDSLESDAKVVPK